jgi:hypothetical protein
MENSTSSAMTKKSDGFHHVPKEKSEGQENYEGKLKWLRGVNGFKLTHLYILMHEAVQDQDLRNPNFDLI